MRISVKEYDIGYRKDAYLFKAYLNGKDISKECVTADEERGEIYVHSRDNTGKLNIDFLNDEIMLKRLTGIVKIRKIN